MLVEKQIPLAGREESVMFLQQQLFLLYKLYPGLYQPREV